MSRSPIQAALGLSEWMEVELERLQACRIRAQAWQSRPLSCLHSCCYLSQSALGKHGQDARARRAGNHLGAVHFMRNQLGGFVQRLQSHDVPGVAERDTELRKGFAEWGRPRNKGIAPSRKFFTLVLLLSE